MDKLNFNNLPEGTEVVVPEGGYIIDHGTIEIWEPFDVRILSTPDSLIFQQRWWDRVSGRSEWRNIPIVEESD